MTRKTVVAILVVILIIGAGTWYYFKRMHHAPIEKILSAPKAFEGKDVTIEGEVTDRTSFFVTVKFFKLRDKTGEIIVLTRGRTLPEIKSKVRVNGRIDEEFAVGDQKFVVFAAGSVDEKGKEKDKK